MSWLARSIANSLRLDDEEDDEAAAAEEKNSPNDAVPRLPPNDAVLREDRPRENEEDRRLYNSDGESSHNHDGDEDVDGDYDQGRGVREDLSELRDSFTRQLWGVASFLAPPPPPPPLPPPPFSHRSDSLRLESKSNVANAADDDDEEEEEEEEEVEVVEELVEYDEREANFSQSNDYYTNILEDAIGITEEVLAFARNIAHHPETWLDFPISEEEEFDDFDISDAQYKHVLAIEHLAPRLAALRFELCPVHMSEGYFWMVYFVLLHSRLNKQDADLLSSPQLVQARAMWMQELQKRTKGDSYWSGISTFHSKEGTDSPREKFSMDSYEDTHFGHELERISPSESSMHQVIDKHEIEKHSLDEIEFVDKSVIKEDPPPKVQDKEMVVSSSVQMPVQDDNDDDDDWLKDDSDLIGYTGTSVVVNEEDISFSDLEDDLDSTMPIKSKTSTTERNTTTETA